MFAQTYRFTQQSKIRSLEIASTMILSVLGVLTFIGCTSRGLSSLGASNELHLRPIQESLLPNGLKVIFIPEKHLPRVSLHAFFKVGAYHDGPDLAGLNYLTAHLMDQGTTSRSASKIAEDFGQLGSELDLDTAPDYTEFEVSGLAQHRLQLLKDFSDVLLNPTFQNRDLERQREQAISIILRKADSPAAVASDQFMELLYGSHPYGVGDEGRLRGLKSIKRQDVIRHYFKHYRPNNTIFVVTGDFDENFKSQVLIRFANWEARPVDVQVPALPSEVQGQKWVLVSKKELAQAQIRIGEFGVRRADPDFIKLRLANVILGGTFVSRLNNRLRAELGLTYGMSSMMEGRADRGPFVMSTSTRNEKAGEALHESLKVFSDFVSKGIADKELMDAKEYMKGQFPMALETVDHYATNLCLLRLYGISDDYLKTFNNQIDRISLKEVNEVIKKHFDPNQLRILVYADQKQVAEALKKVGPFEIRELKRNPL